MTTQMIHPNDEGKKVWLETIASKSGQKVEVVKSVLDKHGVTARQTKAVPQRLTITLVAFSGTKARSIQPNLSTSSGKISLQDCGRC
ncbi:hypothetical protein JUM41_01655 [Rhizobium pusense]|uniref:hypothetical protein n=1 Tax=Agrobacterium pusense TaxID=648995 RepID=UPI001FCC5080|nr:hypothetical protein [Agrobacterium pusense]MCJ2872932.1 hypothetical protein [Agrobacterium pusense]